MKKIATKILILFSLFSTYVYSGKIWRSKSLQKMIMLNRKLSNGKSYLKEKNSLYEKAEEYTLKFLHRQLFGCKDCTSDSAGPLLDFCFSHSENKNVQVILRYFHLAAYSYVMQENEEEDDYSEKAARYMIIYGKEPEVKDPVLKDKLFDKKITSVLQKIFNIIENDT